MDDLSGARPQSACATAQAMPRHRTIVRELGRQPYEPVWRAMQGFTDARDEATPDELVGLLPAAYRKKFQARAG